MNKKALESPIFALYIIGDNIIVASGGGDKKFGVKNKLLLYKIINEKFSDPIFEKDMGNDIPIFITGIPEKKIFLTCVNNKTIFYLLSNNNFNEIHQFQTLDYYTEDIFQSCVAINNNEEPKAVFDNNPGEKSPNAQDVSLNKDEKEPDLNESSGGFKDN